MQLRVESDAAASTSGGMGVVVVVLLQMASNAHLAILAPGGSREPPFFSGKRKCLRLVLLFSRSLHFLEAGEMHAVHTHSLIFGGAFPFLF